MPRRFGWFGFNGGSALAADEVAAYALINTEISASVALIVWMAIEWVFEGKPSLVGVCVGAIAGLATITPAAGFVKPWAAVVIGAAGAIVCYVCVKLVTKLGLDDALDVWGVHGMGGFLGTVLLGALAEHDVNGVSWSVRKSTSASGRPGGIIYYSGRLDAARECLASSHEAS